MLSKRTTTEPDEYTLADGNIITVIEHIDHYLSTSCIGIFHFRNREYLNADHMLARHFAKRFDRNLVSYLDGIIQRLNLKQSPILQQNEEVGTIRRYALENLNKAHAHDPVWHVLINALYHRAMQIPLVGDLYSRKVGQPIYMIQTPNDPPLQNLVPSLSMGTAQELVQALNLRTIAGLNNLLTLTHNAVMERVNWREYEFHPITPRI